MGTLPISHNYTICALRFYLLRFFYIPKLQQNKTMNHEYHTGF
jgi:hypothetical protein